MKNLPRTADEYLENFPEVELVESSEWTEGVTLMTS